MPDPHRILLVACLATASLAGALAYAGSTPRQDLAWKRYYNTTAGYCVSYPSRWYKGDAFDGSGLYVMSGVKKHSRATGEIDIGILRDPSANAARTTTVSLKEDFEVHVDGLKKFERAEKMEVLEQRPMEVAGFSGLLTKDRYYDPQDRSTWIEEVLFVNRQGELFRIELECKADQASRFEAVFSRLIGTLQFDCGNPPRH